MTFPSFLKATMGEPCRVYVGNLAPDTDKEKLVTEFSKYGELADTWVSGGGQWFGAPFPGWLR
jgi:hypothetical protein